VSREPPSPQFAFSMDHGDVRGFIDAGVAMVRCVTPHGDPVEMNADELRALIEQLDGLLDDVRDEVEVEPAVVPALISSPLHDAMQHLSDLIDTWCKRRDFDLLAMVLPAYQSLNGLTDGWGDLRSAVRTARLRAKEASERERLRDVERGLDDMLGRT